MKRTLMLGACGSALLIAPVLAGAAGIAGASVPPACTTQAVAVMAGQQSFVAVRTAIQNDQRAIAADKTQLRRDRAAGDTVAISDDAVTLTAARAQLRADQLVRQQDLQQLHHERHRLQGCKHTVRRMARAKG